MSKFVVLKEIKNANGSWELDLNHTYVAWYDHESAERAIASHKYGAVHDKFKSLDMTIDNLDWKKMFDEFFSDKVRLSIVKMMLLG